jgi:hypothetical protein
MSITRVQHLIGSYCFNFEPTSCTIVSI